jgi:hypothetical protein
MFFLPVSLASLGTAGPLPLSREREEPVSAKVAEVLMAISGTLLVFLKQPRIFVKIRTYRYYYGCYYYYGYAILYVSIFLLQQARSQFEVNV